MSEPQKRYLWELWLPEATSQVVGALPKALTDVVSWEQAVVTVAGVCLVEV